MRVVFMGTPDFAVPCLAELVEEGHEIVGVFTQPDKPVGRKRVITPPEVKVEALKNNLPVYQFEKMKTGEAYKKICELDPEIIVVVAYGKILPKNILDYPKYGCINIHGSLLPKLRGAAPIQWSVINGEKYAGVTSMRMDEGLDTGDMILKKKVEIGFEETSGELYERLSFLGAQVLRETIKLIEENKANYEKQDDSVSTYAPLLDKEMAVIDWNDSAMNIYNKIRGLNPWPIAQTTLEGKKVKIISAKYVENINKDAGQIADANKKIVVSCGDGNGIEITSLQLEGKKAMDTKSFLAGNSLEVNTFFGG